MICSLHLLNKRFYGIHKGDNGDSSRKSRVEYFSVNMCVKSQITVINYVLSSRSHKRLICFQTLLLVSLSNNLLTFALLSTDLVKCALLIEGMLTQYLC